MKRILQIFEWQTLTDFSESLLPSIKINTTLQVLTSSTIIGLINTLLGVNHTTIIAVFVALFAELITGIYASIKRGESLRSAKFGRFVFKAFIWLLSLFIVNAFTNEFAADKTPGTFTLMQWVRSVFILICFFEYMISINENMESITGRKSTFIMYLKAKVKSFLSVSSPINNDSEANQSENKN